VTPSLERRLAAEFVGTAFLLAAIVGSGIMAATSSVDPGLRLLQNALATAGALTAMILALGPVSGAHLNPAVTLADRAFGGLTNRETAGYVVAQIAGGIVGVVLANLMFDLPAVAWSTTTRSGSHLWLAEAVATVGLLLVIFGLVRSAKSVAGGVRGGRLHRRGLLLHLVDRFRQSPPSPSPGPSATPSPGSQPASAPAFVVAELAGVGIAIASIRRLFPHIEDVADRVIVPHTEVRRAPGRPNPADGTFGPAATGGGWRTLLVWVQQILKQRRLNRGRSPSPR
jgi:arsenate reductase (thioredoxin)